MYLKNKREGKKEAYKLYKDDQLKFLKDTTKVKKYFLDKKSGETKYKWVDQLILNFNMNKLELEYDYDTDSD